jgi:trans-2,3-dihydro-3-hydroxyanthranilate isomerase
MPTLRYETLDVFTDTRFGGNPLAVVHGPGTETLTTARMQAVAAEFNYSETTFVLPPDDPAHDARVRIFTPTEEMPFAGHPNVGTAWVLATAAPERSPELRFEELAGLVVVRLSWELDTLAQAEVAAPQALTVGGELSAAEVAACLGCAPDRVRNAAHPPITASVGAPFVFVELEAGTLPGLAPSGEAFARFAARGVGVGIYAYEAAAPDRFEARMFWPAGQVREDPATGSAVAALVALRASLRPDRSAALEVWQGRAMGRLSRLLGRAAPDAEGRLRASVAGTCVPVMRGELTL